MEQKGERGFILTFIALIALGIIAIASYYLFFNDESEDSSSNNTETQEDSENEIPQNVTLNSDQTVLEILQSNEFLVTLDSLIEQEELDTLFDRDNQFTFFAPDSTALSQAELPSTKEEIQQILENHMVQGVIFGSDLVELNGRTIETIGGNSVTVKVENGVIFLNDKEVKIVDNEGSDGVVHIISGVL